MERTAASWSARNRHMPTLSAYETDTAGTNADRTISYTYDALGRQVEVDDDAFATPTVYTYDPAEGRLTP